VLIWYVFLTTRFALFRSIYLINKMSQSRWCHREEYGFQIIINCFRLSPCVPGDSQSNVDVVNGLRKSSM
jgi:hypothetical protein